jgi:hypothetical protein
MYDGAEDLVSAVLCPARPPLVSERVPPARATAVRRRRRPAGTRPRGGTALCSAAASARPAARLCPRSRPRRQKDSCRPGAVREGGVVPGSRDAGYVTARRASVSLASHHPCQNQLRPVRPTGPNNQTPCCWCSHPTWAGLGTRRQPVARRVLDRLATSSRVGAQAGRPRLALDCHDRTVDPSRKCGQRSRAVSSRRGGRRGHGG